MDIISYNHADEAHSKVDSLSTTITTSEQNAANSAAAALASEQAAQTSLTTFQEQYVSQDAQPSTPVAGDLWFDTVNNVMKVYNGSVWQQAASAVNGTTNRYDYVAGTASGGYDGVSLTTFPAIYDIGYVDVYVEGIKLVPTTDFTASSGTSIVLSSELVAGQDLSIVGYGTFLVANTAIDTASFNGILSATENTIQKAFDKLDDALVSGSVDGGVATTVYTALQIIDGGNA